MTPRYKIRFTIVSLFFASSLAFVLYAHAQATATTIGTNITTTGNITVTGSSGNVGIGTASPAARLDIDMGGATGGITIRGNVQPRLDLDTSTSGSSDWNIVVEGNADRFSIRNTTNAITPFSITGGTTGSIFFNPDNNNTDFVVGTSSTSEQFIIDASPPAVAIGATSNRGDGFFTITPSSSTPNSGTHNYVQRVGGTLNLRASSDGSGVRISPTLTEASSGTHALLSGLRVSAPAITAGAATVTNAATLYVADAPSATVTGTNYAVWVDSGQVRFDGHLVVDDASNTTSSFNGILVVNDDSRATNPAFRVEGDTNANLIYVEASTDTLGLGQSPASGTFLTVSPGNRTLDGTSNFVTLLTQRPTYTLTGNLTNYFALSFNEGATFTASSAQTVTNAATVYVAGAPIASTNVTITNPYAMWVDTNNVRFDGNLAVGTASFGTSAASVIALGNGTAPTTSITDGVQLYAEDISSSSELRVRDEAGNITTLSPHNFALFDPDSAYFFPWSFYARNDELGKEINVDMYGAIEALEKIAGKQFIYKRDLTSEIGSPDVRRSDLPTSQDGITLKDRALPGYYYCFGMRYGVMDITAGACQ